MRPAFNFVLSFKTNCCILPRISILLFTIAITSFAIGQEPFPIFSIKKLTPDEGLSQGSNYFRFEDSRGFMWLTGNDAVNRYDGSTVKVYNLDKYFNACPPLQQGYGFAEDNLGNVYIGSVRGLYKYIRSEDRFSLIKVFADSVAMPIGYYDGKIWCFNLQYQLAAYDVASERIQRTANSGLPPLKSPHVYDLTGNLFYFRMPFMDKNKNIWFVGEKKLVCYSIRNHRLENFAEDFIKKNRLTFFCAASDTASNRIFIGTNKGLLQYNLSTNLPKLITQVQDEKLQSVGGLAFSNNLIIINNHLQSLFLTDTAFQKIQYLERSPLINYRKTYQYGFDKSGRLWICNDGEGQLILNFKNFLLPKQPTTELSDAYFKQQGVGNFCEFPGKKILIQSKFFLDANTNSLSEIYLHVPKPLGYKTYTDTFRRGVWLVQESFMLNDEMQLYFADSLLNVMLITSIKKSDNYGTIQSLLPLGKNVILFSFTSGLYWLKAGKRKLEKINGQPYDNSFFASRLSGNRIAISYLNKDMWLAEWNNDNQLHFTRKLLPGVQSFYIAEDTERKFFWVATNNGVFLLNERFETIKKFDANTGLAGTYIYGLLLDNQGYVWCSHQRGLSTISAKTFKIINFTKEDGLQDWDFNNRSFLKASDGTLFFGGVSGFNYFKPPIVPNSYYQPEVYVDEIQVNNRRLMPGMNADNIRTMNLAPDENNIFISVIIKDLDDAPNQQLYYRINGGKWVVEKQKAVIRFNNFSAGDYRLELAVYDKFTDTINIQKQVNFNIALPFYLKIWFFFVVWVVFTAALIWMLYRFKIAAQKRHFNQQIQLEQQRQKITADLHDDIGASLSSLQFNSAVAETLLRQNPAAAATMLGKVQEQSRKLSEKIGDFIWSMKPGKDEFMNLSTRIKTYAADILESSSIYYTIDIDESANHLITDFTKRKNVVLIVKEAVNNAVKYSGAANLTITLFVSAQQATITISDDGVGILPNQKPGNGLLNMKKRTEEMNGIFEIKTVPGKGAAITAVIPLP